MKVDEFLESTPIEAEFFDLHSRYTKIYFSAKCLSVGDNQSFKVLFADSEWSQTANIKIDGIQVFYNMDAPVSIPDMSVLNMVIEENRADFINYLEECRAVSARTIRKIIEC